MTRAKSDTDYPENLPDRYKALWPDLSKWPDATWVREFARVTRKDPDARLAILTGLRRYCSVELGTAWAGVATYFAVVLGLFGAATGVAGELPLGLGWVVWLALIVATAIVALFMFRLMDLSGDADERRRSALTWLAAIEDAVK